jgi:hypothetical protein
MITHVSEFGFGFLRQETVAVPAGFTNAHEQTVTGLPVAAM